MCYRKKCIIPSCFIGGIGGVFDGWMNTKHGANDQYQTKEKCKVLVKLHVGNTSFR